MKQLIITFVAGLGAGIVTSLGVRLARGSHKDTRLTEMAEEVSDQFSVYRTLSREKLGYDQMKNGLLSITDNALCKAINNLRTFLALNPIKFDRHDKIEPVHLSALYADLTGELDGNKTK
jgi:hypothetical protein